jgi:ElaB/YqjD/DUF883 family membrane-anchored ribosome-binding protein
MSTNVLSTDTIEPLRERVSRMISDGRTAIGNLSTSVRRQAGRANKSIRANPYRAIGIAAGVGLLAGYIFSRTRRARRHSSD